LEILKMKRLTYTTLVLLPFLFTTSVMAHTADDPFVTDLIAGGGNPKSAIDVGDVLVWNDCNYLYVQYVITDPNWCITETHLAVATSPDDIPQTKKGNPIPGQFEYYDVNDCITEYTYKIGLADNGWTAGTAIVIAAHAVVWDKTSETEMVIFSNTNTDITQVNGAPVTSKAVEANEPFNYPNCRYYTPDDTFKSLWDDGIGAAAFNIFNASPTADWIWNSLNPENPIWGDVVTFEEPFDVPGLPITGTLYITADNGYSIMLNDTLIGQAQLGPGFPDTLMETVDALPQQGDWGVASQGWQSVEAYLLNGLMSGDNTLAITAANEYMWNDGGYWGPDYYYGSYDPAGPPVNPDPFPGTGIDGDGICRNPAGLIFKASVDYYTRSETGWGAGMDFPGKNWATYLDYLIQDCQCIVRFPETGNAYIGYEDWINGDFDYNDYGMYFSVEEIYIGPCGNGLLSEVIMTFEAAIFDSGMRHLIHIATPFTGSYTYTVSRPDAPAYPNVLTLWDGSTGQETPAGNYSGSGDLDVVLFNTAKYNWPQKQINETVIVHVVLDTPESRPTPATPPRAYNVGSGDFYDLPPLMANYDPWEIGTLFPPPNGSLFHIEDTQVIADTTSQKTYCCGTIIPVDTEVPMILVVPNTDWIPPYEDTTITGPYHLFDDFYTTGSPADWYNTLNPNPALPKPGLGGLSWWP
jgi:hypothetical protein